MSRKNKSLPLFRLLIVGFFALLLGGCAASGTSKLIGQPAPATRVTMLNDGSIVSLDRYLGAGKPLVIAFWATTCTYSPRAMEALDRVAQKLKPQGVEFVAVSIDKADNEQRLRDLIKYRQLGDLTHTFSGNDVYDETFMAYKAGELPFFVVIDGHGIIVAAGDKVSVVEDYFKLS